MPIEVTKLRAGCLAILAAIILSVTSSGAAWPQTHDPLPSWRDGPTKKAITDFVARVTTSGTPDFIQLEARIATFDNDGSLWTEQPNYVGENQWAACARRSIRTDRAGVRPNVVGP